MHAVMFDGVARLHGRSKLARLEQSAVAVIGLGGVGSWCAEALARSGVGALVLADLDEVCVSNTNRQIHATKATYGRSKCEVMAERLRQINPAIRIHLVNDFITGANVEGFLEECAAFAREGGGAGIDFVIDCVDQERHKAAIIARCAAARVPVITTGGCGGLADPSGIVCDDLNLSSGDPLLSKVRVRLRKEHGFGGAAQAPWDVTAVFSPLGGGADGRRLRARRGNMACGNGAGSSVMVTGSFGLFAASECLAQILMRAERDESRRRASAAIERVFDSHCHAAARGRGPSAPPPPPWRVGVMGTGPDDWDACASLSEERPARVRVGFGLHPFECEDYLRRHEPAAPTSADAAAPAAAADALCAELRRRLDGCPRAVVGEIGLDKAVLKRRHPRDGQARRRLFNRQVCCFEAQMRLACALGRPAVLHVVQAYGYLERHLMSRIASGSPLPPRILLHSYSGSAQLVRRLSGLCEANGVGLYFGLSYGVNVRPSAAGAVCSPAVSEVIDAVPDDRLLIESDGHLAAGGGEAAGLREDLLEVIHVVSTVKGWEVERAIDATAENGERFYAAVGSSAAALVAGGAVRR